MKYNRNLKITVKVYYNPEFHAHWLFRKIIKNVWNESCHNHNRKITRKDEHKYS